MRILRYCGVLKRALDIDEFSELLGVSVGQQSFDQTEIPMNLELIIGDCCGLIYVDEEDRTLHYVHHSIKKYLFSQSSPMTSDFVEEDIDHHLGLLALTYLNFSDFNQRLVKAADRSRFHLEPLQIGTTAISQSSALTSSLA